MDERDTRRPHREGRRLVFPRPRFPQAISCMVVPTRDAGPDNAQVIPNDVVRDEIHLLDYIAVSHGRKEKAP